MSATTAPAGLTEAEARDVLGEVSDAIAAGTSMGLGAWATLNRLRRLIPSDAASERREIDALREAVEMMQILRDRAARGVGDVPRAWVLDNLADILAHVDAQRGADGLALVAAERQRQVNVEGWAPEHDDGHTNGELAEAAAAYTIPPHGPEREGSASVPPAVWPWSAEYWKPTPKDRVRELVKAGALIVAEIERLQRAAGADAGGTDA